MSNKTESYFRDLDQKTGESEDRHAEALRKQREATQPQATCALLGGKECTHPMPATPPQPRSWAPEVIADSSGKWCGNALRFATKEEAEANVQDLHSRWMLVSQTRVVPSDDPVNYRWVGGKLERVN